MSEEMQQSAVDVASHALSKYNIEKVSQVIDAFFLSRVFLFVSFFNVLSLIVFPFFRIYYVIQDVAAYIKKEFDKKYNPTWHVIVGRNFGSYVTHETKHFIYFYLGQCAILLFKSGQTIQAWGGVEEMYICMHQITLLYQRDDIQVTISRRAYTFRS